MQNIASKMNVAHDATQKMCTIIYPLDPVRQQENSNLFRWDCCFGLRLDIFTEIKGNAGCCSLFLLSHFL